MKTDMEIKVENAKEKGIFENKRESNYRISCGCGYSGKAPVIRYDKVEEIDDGIALTICPNCDSV